LPFYDAERIWDGRIYLVTYDIVEERKSDREKLRQTLLRLGCAKLQASVYLTPYNPAEVLRESLEKHGLQGAVLVSNLGGDGSIGDEDLKELLARIYDLRGLNAEYGAFLAKYRHRVTDKNEMIFAFLNVLQKDSQLPFALLPEWWLGDKAYHLLQKRLRP
jgi:phenylacetic acid degradation operon negative regulatory protein